MTELNIINEKENPLFKRKEVKVVLEAEKALSKDEAAKIIANSFSAKPESIAIKKISGKFGVNTFKIDANLYHSEEDKLKTEPKPKEKKK
jgi:ribosomal protein S24E